MSEQRKPLLLHDYEVRAILRGATQLRRALPLERQNMTGEGICFVQEAAEYAYCTWKHDSGLTMSGYLSAPFGMAGSEFWVREPWAKLGGDVWYRADGNTPNHADVAWYTANLRQNGKRWMSGVTMGRQRSRLNLRVLSVNIQRLRSVTTEQAAACLGGVPIPEHGGQCFELSEEPLYFTDCPACQLRNRFIGEWWNALERKAAGKLINTNFNPWVWAVDVERLDSSLAPT